MKSPDILLFCLSKLESMVNLGGTHLKEGSKAPVIKAKNQNGEIVSLSDFKGKKLILYFYPKDDTPGCTAQSCNLRDNYKMMKKQGFEILGVSCDSEKSHQKFIKKFKLPFQLLADEEKKVVSDYGVWGRKKFMGREFDGIRRTTFVINEKGIIDEIIEKVDTKEHTNQIIK